MTNESLLLEKHPDGVAILTFNRPEAMNALMLAMMDNFAQMIASLQADSDLRVLILTGALADAPSNQPHAAFCSGGDLHELSQYPAESDARRMITVMGDALLMLERLPVPVIAALNGYALGGGAEIALACDLRIVDEQVRMGFVQLKWALITGWGAGQRLLRLVGYSKAMELLLRRHVMGASELLELGLANQSAAAGKALEHALQWASMIASNPPEVIHALKAMLQAGLRHPYEEALRLERDLFPPLWAADAHLNAVEAFLNKQKKSNG